MREKVPFAVLTGAIAVIVLVMNSSVGFAFSSYHASAENVDNTAGLQCFTVAVYSYTGYDGSTPDSFDCSGMDFDSLFERTAVTSAESVINYSRSGSVYVIDDTVDVVPANTFLVIRSEGYDPEQSFEVSLSASITNDEAAIAYGDCLTLSLDGAVPAEGRYTLASDHAYRIHLTADIDYSGADVPPPISASVTLTGIVQTVTNATYSADGGITLVKTASDTFNDIVDVNDENDTIPSSEPGSDGYYTLTDGDPVDGHDTVHISGNDQGGITEEGSDGLVNLVMNIPESKAFIIKFDFADSELGQKFVLNVIDDEYTYVVDGQTFILPATGGTRYLVANGVGYATLRDTIPAANYSGSEYWFRTTGSGIGSTTMTFIITSSNDEGRPILSSTEMSLIFVPMEDLD